MIRNLTRAIIVLWGALAFTGASFQIAERFDWAAALFILALLGIAARVVVAERRSTCKLGNS